jgi:hypothetical protein
MVVCSCQSSSSDFGRRRERRGTEGLLLFFSTTFFLRRLLMKPECHVNADGGQHSATTASYCYDTYKIVRTFHPSSRLAPFFGTPIRRPCVCLHVTHRAPFYIAARGSMWYCERLTALCHYFNSCAPKASFFLRFLLWRPSSVRTSSQRANTYKNKHGIHL